MVNKKYPRRVAYSFGVIGLLFGFAACGDDGGSNAPDAGSTPEVDAMCSGHGCPGVDSPFQLPEGGEMRIEFFQFGPNPPPPLEGDLAAVQFFLFTGQDPEIRGPGKLIEHDLEGIDCFDVSDGVNFDNGYSEVAQAIANSRSYIDVGENVTMTDADGEEIVLSKLTNDIDFSSNLTHDIIYRADMDFPKFNMPYTFKVAGTAEVPGLDLAFGETPFGVDRPESEPPTMFFPRQFTLDSPTEEEFFAGLSVSRDEDLTISWTYEGDLDPEWPAVASFIGFGNADGQGIVGCSAAANGADGDSITIPTEALALAPEGGSLLVGFFHHIGYEERQTATRFDTLGINCKAAGFEIAEEEEEETTE